MLVRNTRTRNCHRFIMATILLFLSVSALAQGSNNLEIVVHSPVHGWVIADPTVTHVRVTGEVIGVSQLQPGDVTINGMQAQVFVNSNAFTADVALPSTGRAGHGGVFYSFKVRMINHLDPQRDLARGETAILDLRSHPLATMQPPDLAVTDGAVFRLTPSGLDKLEEPFPFMFNTELINARMQQIIGSGDSLPSSGDPLVCYDPSMVALLLDGFDGALMLTQYLLGQTFAGLSSTVLQGLDSVIPGFNEGIFVDLFDDLFENQSLAKICLVSLTPKITSLRYEQTDIDYVPGNDFISTDVTASELAGDVEITAIWVARFEFTAQQAALADLLGGVGTFSTIQQILAAAGLARIDVPLPDQGVCDAEYSADRADAVGDLEVMAAFPETTFLINQLSLLQFSTPSFTYSGSGVCDIEAFDLFIGSTEDDIDQKMEELLSLSFNQGGASATELERAVGEQLSTMEGMTFPAETRLVFTQASFQELLVREDTADVAEPAGVIALFDTRSKVDGPVARLNNPAFINDPGVALNPGQLTTNGDSYHFMLGVSTGTLNQALLSAAKTRLLSFELNDFTYNDLDLCTAGIPDCDSPAILDAKTLGQLAPELADIDPNEVLSVRYRPTLAPQIIMEQDSFPDPPLAFFEATTYLIEFYSISTGDVWLTLSLEMGSDFDLEFADMDGDFEPVYSGLISDAHVLQWATPEMPADVTRLGPFVAPATDAILAAVKELPAQEFDNLPFMLFDLELMESIRHDDYFYLFANFAEDNG